jgi:hypothetical protein
MENKYRHLSLIQDIVKRFANNSFLLKGWSISLMAGLLALSSALQDRRVIIVISLFPSIIFCILDGYYLFQERIYRRIYETVRQLKEEEINFSLNTDDFKISDISWAAAMCSKTILLFYGTLLIISMTVSFLL